MKPQCSIHTQPSLFILVKVVTGEPAAGDGCETEAAGDGGEPTAAGDGCEPAIADDGRKPTSACDIR